MRAEPRYAVYFAPAPDSALWQLGSAWLGRDAWRHCAVPAPTLANIREDTLRAFTQHPRRYGFHATLKAPFHLAQPSGLNALLADVEALAAREACFALPALRVAQVDDFLALVPAHGCRRLADLERRCVMRFDAHRRPLDEADLARRRTKPLSPLEDALLERWGYPHVLDAFRLHFTLSDSFAGAHPRFVDQVRAEAMRIFASELDAPRPFDALSVFAEAHAGADFELIARMPFGKSGRLVYVIGPSGAGKDSVIAWARDHLSLQRDIVFARRVITRPADASGERHEAVSDAVFTRLLARDAFAMQWAAHDCRYAIRKEALAQRRLGMTVVVNGSREHLPVARGKFPDLEVVHITAAPEVLAHRLRERAREDQSAMAGRLARANAFATHDVDLEIRNDGPLAEAGLRLLRWLTRPAAPADVEEANPPPPPVASTQRTSLSDGLQQF
ncbi:MAG: phosphonate metabolism protein/1,5-bisphosphokinase (PRPP-forming) PhnN [Betaproteobacteria bacterium]|nr:phosphonate metabolism protein/1,5-bisphosphokinase (PRPP-forming) PhnN [Betaproteobacteria bacterium]